jgi:hypothetical protein
MNGRGAMTTPPYANLHRILDTRATDPRERADPSRLKRDLAESWH